MMMKCPKCGFSQPKDQYCANCGVDVGIYRPPTRPFYIFFLQTPFFSLLLLSLIGLGGIFLLQHRENQDIQRQIQYLQRGRAFKVSETKSSAYSPQASNQPKSFPFPQEAETAKNRHLALIDNTTEQPTNKTQAPAQTSKGQTSKKADQTNRVGKTNKAGTANTTGTDLSPQKSSAVVEKALSVIGTAGGTRKNQGQKKNLVMHFVEMTHDFYQKMMQKSISTGRYETFTDYSAGVIDNKNKSLSMAKSGALRPLQKTNLSIASLLRKKEKGEERFFGDFVPQIGLKAGFTVYIEVTEYQKGTVKGYIELLREMKGIGNSDLQNTYSLGFELPPRAILFFSNLMPSNMTFPENKLSYLKHPLFQIFKSPSFKEKRSLLAFVMVNE